MAITLSEIRVGFHGEGAGAGELTWGQMNISRASERFGGQASTEDLPGIYMKVWADAEHFALDQVERR